MNTTQRIIGWSGAVVACLLIFAGMVGWVNPIAVAVFSACLAGLSVVAVVGWFVLWRKP